MSCRRTKFSIFFREEQKCISLAAWSGLFQDVYNSHSFDKLHLLVTGTALVCLPHSSCQRYQRISIALQASCCASMACQNRTSRAKEPVAGSPGLTLALVSGLSARLPTSQFLEISNHITRWSENSLLSGGISLLWVYSKKEGSGIPILKINRNNSNSVVCTSKYQFTY